MRLRLSQTGLVMLAAMEGLRLVAYRCRSGVLTIGYGHTAGVAAGSRISARRAHELLLEDVGAAEVELKRILDGKEVTQAQWDALVLLVFNVGGAALSDSRLMRKLRSGDVAGAAAEFPLWNKDRDPKTKKLRVSSILVARRSLERSLFEADL